MTYCVGLRLKKGLVFMSDTRTNAGVDNFARTKKMFTWEVPGERVITLLTAGNLATTQALVGLIKERSKAPEDRSEPTILREHSMFQVARLVGNTLREVISEAKGGAEQEAGQFQATVILGGQIKGSDPTLFLIYPEGNFIEVTDETPFFQIGELKYGRPILVRAFDEEMDFDEAIKLLAISFDSTLKANLSVGMPFDVMTYENDALAIGDQFRIEEDDASYSAIASAWGGALRDAFNALPDYKRPE